MHPLFVSHVEAGRQSPKIVQNHLGVLGPAHADRVGGAEAAQQDHRAVRILKVHRGGPSGLHQAHHAHHGTGENPFAQRFVVQADVAAGDGRFEEQARLGHAFNGLHQLRHDFRTLGIAEVQVVGGGHWQGAGRGQIAAAFGHDQLDALARIQQAITLVAVQRHGDGRAGFLDADDGGVGARSFHRVRAHGVIVLLPNPALGTQVGRGQQGDQVGFEVRRTVGQRGRFQRNGAMGLHVVRTVVQRGFIGQVAVGNLRHDRAVIAYPQNSVAGDDADGNGVQSPFAEDGEHLVFAAFFGHQQHALLRFRKHDVIRGHAGFALRHQFQIDLDAGAGPAAHLARGTGQARGAHVLNSDDSAGLHRFQARFQQQLLKKRIAHLNVGALLLRFFSEFARRHGCAVDAVAPGFGAHVDHRIADPRGLAVENFVLVKHPQGEDVHQRIAAVAAFENALAAHRGHAEAVPVMRDAGHHAFHHAAVAGRIERAEAEGVQHRDGPRAHGEDVAQNSAHAGGRALKRFDEAGMVVRLDLEGDGPAAAYVDDACVLARALQDQLAARRELFQMQARAFIRAVFAPHHAEDAEFGQRRFASQQGQDFFVFSRGDLMMRDHLRRNRWDG